MFEEGTGVTGFHTVRKAISSSFVCPWCRMPLSVLQNSCPYCNAPRSLQPASQSRLLDAAHSRRVLRNLTVITGSVLAVGLVLHLSASSFGQMILGLMLLCFSAPIFVLFAVMYVVSAIVESRQAGKAREHAVFYIASALMALAILALLLFRLIA